jgi:competence protein
VARSYTLRVRQTTGTRKGRGAQTVPSILAHFNQLSLIGIVANLVVVPLAAAGVETPGNAYQVARNAPLRARGGKAPRSLGCNSRLGTCRRTPEAEAARMETESLKLSGQSPILSLPDIPMCGSDANYRGADEGGGGGGAAGTHTHCQAWVTPSP